MSQFSTGLVTLAEKFLQGAKPQHYTIEQIESAIARHNANKPAQRWSFRRHRNGALVKCGREKLDLPLSGVFIHPQSWSIGWDGELHGNTIVLHYNTSASGKMLALLADVGMLNTSILVPDLECVYISNMMTYARYFLRHEADQVLQEIQDELADAFRAELAGH